MTAPTHGDGRLRPPAGVRLLEPAPVAGEARVAIVASRYHSAVNQALLEGAVRAAGERGVGPERLDLLPVAGAFELPLAAREAGRSGRYAAVVALGCVLRGETPHFDYVAGEAARGVTLASLETGVPVGFGVLTCDTPEQAWARAGGGLRNTGEDAMHAALDLAGTLAVLRTA